MTKPKYLALLRRQQVDKRKSYASYRPELRIDFYFSCGYCTTMETEIEADAFKIDHYLPKSKHRDREADFLNLVWSYRRCNRLKGDIDSNDEMYFLCPDRHTPVKHMSLSGEVMVPATKAGKHNITILSLNRRELRRIRGLRRRLSLAEAAVAEGVKV